MITDIQRFGRFFIRNLEAFFWIAAILVFAISPVNSGEHFTICPLSFAGFEHCPGCGLGRSMILFLHGQVTESIAMHPLALFALVVFVIRIVVVFRNNFRFQKQVKGINAIDYQKESC